jgi:putative hydrolase of the HAD superfamily
MPLPAIIFFDAANTLIRPHPGVGAVYSAVAREHARVVPAEALEAAFLPAWGAVRQARGGSPYGPTEAHARAFWRQVVALTFERAGAAMPADPFFDVLYDRFGTAACWRVDQHARPALERVRAAGVRTGLLSNFDARLRPLLTRLDLERHLDVVVISCEVGAEKPHPAIFEAARRRAGIADPARIAFIGDQRLDDFEGAARAGWRPILLDPSGTVADDGLRQTATTLLDAVEALLA